MPELPSNAVAISHRERVIFPDSGETKGDLADWYEAIAPLMLPFAAGRPTSLVRCPQGRARKCFFQKHDAGTFGPHVLQVPIAEKDGGTEDYIYVEDAQGLLACVQMGTIEFHGWAARADAVNLPRQPQPPGPARLVHGEPDARGAAVDRQDAGRSFHAC